MNLFDEIKLPYTIPDGTYFILVDTAAVKIPTDFEFPDYIKERGRNYEMCYWLCVEIGISSIPISEFYSEENAHLAETIVRFAFCKDEETLHVAAEKLRKLQNFMQD